MFVDREKLAGRFEDEFFDARKDLAEFKVKLTRSLGDEKDPVVLITRDGIFAASLWFSEAELVIAFEDFEREERHTYGDIELQLQAIAKQVIRYCISEFEL
jgi:hypothetical protein